MPRRQKNARCKPKKNHYQIDKLVEEIVKKELVKTDEKSEQSQKQEKGS